MGAETKLMHLYDIHYTGCRSCFGCKLKNNKTYRCIWRDDLASVLDEIYEANALVLGSPIYFGDISGQMISFLERLCFPLLSYENTMKQDLQKRAGLLQRLGGIVEVYASCNTYQFSDYSKYHAASFNEEHKSKVKEEQFPKDLKIAFNIGCQLVTK